MSAPPPPPEYTIKGCTHLSKRLCEIFEASQFGDPDVKGGDSKVPRRIIVKNRHDDGDNIIFDVLEIPRHIHYIIGYGYYNVFHLCNDYIEKRQRVVFLSSTHLMHLDSRYVMEYSNAMESAFEKWLEFILYCEFLFPPRELPIRVPSANILDELRTYNWLYCMVKAIPDRKKLVDFIRVDATHLTDQDRNSGVYMDIDEDLKLVISTPSDLSVCTVESLAKDPDVLLLYAYFLYCHQQAKVLQEFRAHYAPNVNSAFFLAELSVHRMFYQSIKRTLRSIRDTLYVAIGLSSSSERRTMELLYERILVRVETILSRFNDLLSRRLVT